MAEVVTVGRERLPNHSGAEDVRVGSGGCAIAFALPFVAVGAFALAASFGLTPIDASTIRSTVVLRTFGAVFALAGLLLVGVGIHAILKRRDQNRRREEHPNEPWRWDRRWNEEHEESGGLGPAMRAFGTSVFLAIFLAGFNAVVFFGGGNAPLPVQGLILLFDVAALGVFAYGVYLTLQYFKYGRSRLRFAKFPFRPGGVFEATLEAGDRIATATEIRLRLRYIEDVTEWTRSGSKSRSVIVSYRIYEATDTVRAETTQGGSIPVRFRLPEGSYATRLLDPARRYWLLDVEADTPGIDYAAKFLVPVY